MREALPDPLLQRLAVFEVADARLAVQFHPAEFPVEFAEAADHLTCSAATSHAGPGYHAFLVDLLETLRESCDAQWNWGDTRGSGDETGFAQHRDFSALRQHMWREFLREVRASARYQQLVEQPLSLPMPVDFEVYRLDHVTTVDGFRPRRWLEAASQTSAEDADVWGPECFPWWQRERDARFWERCARILCWTRVPWHVPQDPDVRRLYELVLDLFSRARELDPEIALPDQEIRELRQLLASPSGELAAPDSNPMGYLRRPVRWHLPLGWSLVLPGYYYRESRLESPIRHVFSFEHRSVTLGEFPRSGQEPNAILQEICEVLQADAAETLKISGDGFVGRVFLRELESNRGAPHVYEIAYAAAEVGCIGSISLHDPSDRDWAIRVAKSVRFQPPPETHGD